MDGLSNSWPKVALGDLATFVNGTSYDRGLLAESGTPIIRISNISDPRSEYLTTSQEFVDKYAVRADDLLVSWSASFKSIIWPGPTGVLNQHIFKVSEKPGNHRGFLRHAIEAVFDDMRSKVVGIGMMHLRRSDFLGHPVPTPDWKTQEAVCQFLDWVEKPNGQSAPSLPADLSRQRRIVARIEELAARIEEARGLRRQAVEEARALQAAASKAAFERVHGDANDVVALGDIAEVRAGVTLGRKLGGPTIRLPYLRVANVQDSYLDLDIVKEVEILPSEVDKWSLEPGDILLTEGGDWDKLGRGTVWRGEIRSCIHQNHIYRLRVNPSDYDPDFLSALIGSPYGKSYFQAAAKQTTNLATINQKQLKAFQVPCLSLNDQQSIVAYLDDLQAKVASLRRLQAETTAELDALLPSVLDRAFKGKL